MDNPMIYIICADPTATVYFASNGALTTDLTVAKRYQTQRYAEVMMRALNHSAHLGIDTWTVRVNKPRPVAFNG